jgi:hypothetical protein
MKRAPIGVNSVRTAAAGGARLNSSCNAHMGDHMKSKKQPAVRQSTKQIANPRSVRFGSGMAPASLRARDAKTQDSGKVRFGSGMAPASLRK